MKRYLESIKLCFAYYKQPLCLRDVSFSVSKGKKILILGVAEVGKTTLVKAISGFDSTYMGEVRFDGKNIKTIPDNEKKFSLLLAEPVFLSGNIRKNIDYLCEVESIEKISPEQLKVLFDKFGFVKDESEKIKNLSLLEKRKLAVIRAYLKSQTLCLLMTSLKGLMMMNA
jgi:ATP-binding cassette subfamily B protein